MMARLLVVIVGVPLMYAGLVWHDLSRVLLFAVAAIFGMRELFAMFAPKGVKPPVLDYSLGLAILWAAETQGEHGLLMATTLSIIILAIAVVLRGLDYTGFKLFSLGVASILYIPFCLSFLLMIAHGPDLGGRAVFAVLTMIWSLDIGAYLSGRALGGPKLASFISPNKTIAGAAGGIVACFLAVWGMQSLGWITLSANRMVALGLGVGIVGQLSDLFESVLKREAGVKDSGTVFGAHGGMLDRLDSVLFVGPLAYGLLML